MTQPLTKAQQLHAERADALVDPASPIDPFTLRRWINEFQSALASSTGDDAATLHLMLGIAYGRLKDHRRSLDARKSAVHASPNLGVHLNNVASCLIEIGRPREALDYLRRARTKPYGNPRGRVVIPVNEAEAHHRLGDLTAANLAMNEAVSVADLNDPIDLFHLATQSAVIGREDDAVEFLARHLGAVQRRDVGEELAIDVVRSSPPELLARLPDYPALAAAVSRVGARHDEPEPADMQTSAEMRVAPVAWDRLTSLLDQPLEST